MRVLAAALLLLPALAHADDPSDPRGGGEIGVGAGVHLVSTKTALLGGGNRAPGNTFAVNLRVGRRIAGLFAVEAEVEAGSVSTRDTDAQGALFGYRGLVSWRFRDHSAQLRPFVMLGVGGATAVVSRPSSGRESDTIFQGVIGGGLEIGMGDAWGLRFEARELLGPGGPGHSLSGDFQFIFGLAWSSRGSQGYVEKGQIEDTSELREEKPDRDSDDDGLPNSKDRCPITAEDKDGHDDDDGCPDLDDDGDGILEPIDRCPGEAEDVDQVDDDDGCPDPDGAQ